MMKNIFFILLLSIFTISSCRRAVGAFEEGDGCHHTRDCLKGLICVAGECVSDDSERETEGFDSDTNVYHDSSTSSSQKIDTGSENIPFATDPETDSLGINWIPISGGTYEMGDEEKGQTTVIVPSFWMTKTEITVFQYRKCVDSGVCPEPVPDDCDDLMVSWAMCRLIDAN